MNLIFDLCSTIRSQGRQNLSKNDEGKMAQVWLSFKIQYLCFGVEDLRNGPPADTRGGSGNCLFYPQKL